MRLALKITLAIVLLTAAGLVLAYLYLPVNRVAITSELVMIGDLNNDNRWDLRDAETLSNVLADPFRSDRRTMLKIDVNRNDLIDEEDVSFLEHLYQFSDPYLAQRISGSLFYMPNTTAATCAPSPTHLPNSRTFSCKITTCR